MQYRKITASRIFDGNAFVSPGQVLMLQEDGTVAGLVPAAEAGEGVETLEGVLTPGFINSHCHLELSHLKGVIPPGTGLVPFLISVVKERGRSEEEKEEAFRSAEAELYRNGTAGVADICNTADTLAVKVESRMRWHNLVEVLNFYDAGLQQSLDKYGQVLNGFRQQHLSAVLTPHAPYTISAATFAAINQQTAGAVLSVHNQETPAEDELFRTGGGAFLHLFSAFADGRSPFAVSGRSSLQTWLPHFTEGQTILLVHVTFTREEDLFFAREHAARYGLKLLFVLCPNANRYIEETLPPVELFLKEGCSLALGTDSYSSNWQLSIPEEIKTLRASFPHLPLETWLKAATGTAAQALGWEESLGFFRKGARPGVVLLGAEDLSVARIL